MARALSDAERIDWLRLIRSENVGPMTFTQLLARFGSAAAALAALPELARRGGRKSRLRITARSDAEREIDALARLGGRLVARIEPDYPPPLAAITDAPPLIAVQGHAHLLGRAVIAIVGARNASAAGCRIAREIAADLGRAGHVVVSGLARGIDAAAHAGALESGTAAVIAGGVDVVYPKENQALHEAIAASGVLVSEMPLGTVPTARHFPRRNRLISGLALGVLVVEAAPRSGSLITARLALEQGREVFAVPGSPLDGRHRGTNDLIRQGAVLTENAADILAALPDPHRRPLLETEADPAAAPPVQPAENELARARAALVEKLGPTPVSVDELVRQCQVTVATAAVVLLELELAGRIERLAGNRVFLVIS